MEKIKAKRGRASKEEMIARLEKQNSELEAKIEGNKKRIEELKKPTYNLRDLAARMKDAGLSVEDVITMIDSKQG